ncbi:MAG TPA: dihydroneopterin aldolase [Chloroflexia bacterium]|nr:dihydroneopterin aldolase [Chloroflexia bacterium]
MSDQIILQNMIFFGTHGVNPEEQVLGQRFGIDLTLWVDLESAAKSDDLGDTVSYSAMYKLVRAEVEGAPSMLLENLAARILRAVLNADRRITRAATIVSKLSPPLKGSSTGEVAVSLDRARDWLDSWPTQPDLRS